MGRGLAYGKKVGDLLLDETIEKIYELSGDGQSRVTDLLSGIPDEVLEIADAIATFAKETITGKVNDSLFLTLADHINGVVIRLKDDMVKRQLNKFHSNIISNWMKTKRVLSPCISSIVSLGVEIPQQQVI